MSYSPQHQCVTNGIYLTIKNQRDQQMMLNKTKSPLQKRASAAGCPIGDFLFSYAFIPVWMDH